MITLFPKYGITLDFPRGQVMYPPLAKAPPITCIGKRLTIGSKSVFIGVPVPVRLMMKLGCPKQAFHPYLNLTFIPQGDR